MYSWVWIQEQRIYPGGVYSLVFILRQQTCTLLLPISLTISISCTLFQELYNRFLSVFTLQLENPRNANKIFAIASHVMSHCLLIYPDLGWWHICWGRLIDIVFWKSQCDGQTQNHAFFVRLKMLLLTERQRRQPVSSWQMTNMQDMQAERTLHSLRKSPQGRQLE